MPTHLDQISNSNLRNKEISFHCMCNVQNNEKIPGHLTICSIMYNVTICQYFNFILMFCTIVLFIRRILCHFQHKIVMQTRCAYRKYNLASLLYLIIRQDKTFIFVAESYSANLRFS